MRGKPLYQQQLEYDTEHHITDANKPTCKICGKPVRFHNYKYGYHTHCSLSCAGKDTRNRNKLSQLDKQITYNTEHNITDANRPTCKICGKPAYFSNTYNCYFDTCKDCTYEQRRIERDKRSNSKIEQSVDEIIEWEKRALENGPLYRNAVHVCRFCLKPITRQNYGNKDKFETCCFKCANALQHARKYVINQQQYDIEHGYTVETRPKCPVCGKRLGFKKNKGYLQTCSVHCRSIYTNSQFKNGLSAQQNYDKEHGFTVETRPKCEVCGKPTAFMTYNRGYRRFCSEYCKRYSMNHKYIYKNGFLRLKYCIAGHKYYRSSFEKEFFINLERLKLTYEIETLLIQYWLNHKKYRYTPDVIVHYKDILIIVEIKPHNFICHEAVQRKTKATLDYVQQSNNPYDAYIILDEHTLFDTSKILQVFEQIYAQVKSQQLHKLLNSLTCQK